MFEAFVGALSRQPDSAEPVPWMPPAAEKVAGMNEFPCLFAGASFDSGLYRTVDATSGPWLQRAAVRFFPEFRARILVFGYDWMGRVFGVDFGRVVDREPLVLRLDVGSGDAIQIPTSFVRFHDEEVVEFKDDVTSESYFQEWLASPGSAGRGPGPDQCVGFQVPLFLGGVDDLENLATQDLQVYWDLTGQLRLQTHGLAEGTQISGIEPA